MEFKAERRKHTRHQPGDSAIAINGSNPGHIRDISQGGLSFVYLNMDNRNVSESSHVDVMDSQKEFFMESIPCQKVSDQILLNESPFSLTTMVKRRLEFGELTPSQKVMLDRYISHYTQ